LKNSSKAARANFNKKGEALVNVVDTIQYNGGIWIDESLKMKQNSDHSEIDVSGIGCPISMSNPLEMF